MQVKVILLLVLVVGAFS